MFVDYWKTFFSIFQLLLVMEKSLAKNNTNSQNSSGHEIGYFWHVSDVFFDPAYSPLGAPENDCHIKNAVNFTRNCGFFGELGQCSAFGLVETIARAMNSTRWKNAGTEFCIFTGNLRCPNGENPSEAIYETMRAFITDIQNAGFVNVYPSYGWYDYHPYGRHPLKLTTPYDKLRNLLHAKKINPPILGQLGQKTGYFSRVELPEKKIRIIVINTNFYVKNHIASRLTDPAGQWKWLRDQLEECRVAVQKAFIVMSIPPGVHRDCYENMKNGKTDLLWSDRHNRRYIEIVNEYHDAISVQFAGHRHEDSFRLVYNTQGNAVSTILLAPAINPSFGNYPSMRIYMYNKQTGELLDFVQYYFNLTRANLEADMTIPEKYWEVSYSFRDFYLLPNATTSSFEKLVQKMKINDVLFQRYYRNAEGLTGQRHKCKARCKLISFCEITTVDSGSFFECISGEIMTHERRIQESKPAPEALRNRLIRHGTNSVFVSISAASPRFQITIVFQAVISSILFVK